MKNRAKKNNKGFSLVELIVVVLIIGVIAVALAPQVMKWVGESKDNTDNNNAATLKSSVQAALADWQSEGGTIPTSGNNAIYTVTNTTTLTPDTVNGTDWTYNGDTEKLSVYINEATAGDYVMPNDTTKKFKIVVSISTGKVSVTIE